MLDKLTVEAFVPHVGGSFWVEFPNDSKVELRLTSASKVMESEAANLPRHPFSLYFVGPKSYRLQQQMYRVTHQTLDPMEIFIVPVGETSDTYQYEAVFT